MLEGCSLESHRTTGVELEASAIEIAVGYAHLKDAVHGYAGSGCNATCRAWPNAGDASPHAARLRTQAAAGIVGVWRSTSFIHSIR